MYKGHILFYIIISFNHKWKLHIDVLCTMYIMNISSNSKTWSWNAMLNPPLWQLLRKTDGIGRQWWWCIHLKISLKRFKFPWGFFQFGKKSVLIFSDFQMSFSEMEQGRTNKIILHKKTNPNSNPAALLSSQVSIRLWISASKKQLGNTHISPERLRWASSFWLSKSSRSLGVKLLNPPHLTKPYTIPFCLLLVDFFNQQLNKKSPKKNTGQTDFSQIPNKSTTGWMPQSTKV